MAAPATTHAFLDLVRKSELVDSVELTAYLDARTAEASLPEVPKKAARRLIKDGLLTRFQAEQLLSGRYKPFTLGGKYRLLERLGVGGMGFVYLCEHLVLRRQVAVKVLPTAHADSPAVLERFLREARASASLNHPNLVRTHDINSDGKMHFLVMDYVDGRSFHEIVTARGPLAVERTAHYISQAALGLQHAHEHGLVHRDVKPANMLLDRTGVVKVLDLGLARFFLDDADDLTRLHGGLTVLGTADYVAPEQALDSHSADIRADLYSLGCTWYFLLTGAPPFDDCKSLGKKLMAHQTQEPRPIRELRSDVPEELAAILAKMLAKKPEARYQTPAELYDALEPWTRNLIAPPGAEEMPKFCPAIQSSGHTITNRQLPVSALKLQNKQQLSRSVSTPLPSNRSDRLRSSPHPSRSTPTPAAVSSPGRGPLVWFGAFLALLAAGACGYFLR